LKHGDTYPIGPTTTGRVHKVPVDVGDTARAGQLLAEPGES
jgi:multidrug efflux pump subunit AcrA (membrane-fusion protein)